MNTRTIGVGLLTLALGGGGAYLALARQAQPAAQVQGKHADEADEEVIKLADAPAPVRSALAKVTPADKVTKVIREEHDGAYTFEVEYLADGTESSAVFSAAGDLMEIEKAAKESSLPEAVRAVLAKKFPNTPIHDAVLVQKFVYEVNLGAEGKTPVVVDAAGVIEKAKHRDEADEEDEGDEEHEHEGEDKK